MIHSQKLIFGVHTLRSLFILALVRVVEISSSAKGSGKLWENRLGVSQFKKNIFKAFSRPTLSNEYGILADSAAVFKNESLRYTPSTNYTATIL